LQCCIEAGLTRGEAGQQLGAQLGQQRGQVSIFRTDKLFEALAQAAGQCRAGAAGADRQRKLSAAHDGGDDEIAVFGIVHHVDQLPATHRTRGHGMVDRRIICGRDHQPRGVQVVFLVFPRDGGDLARCVQLCKPLDQRRADHADVCTARKKALHLAQRHCAAADHDAFSIRKVDQVDRIAPHGRILACRGHHRQ